MHGGVCMYTKCLQTKVYACIRVYAHIRMYLPIGGDCARGGGGGYVVRARGKHRLEAQTPCQDRTPQHLFLAEVAHPQGRLQFHLAGGGRGGIPPHPKSPPSKGTPLLVTGWGGMGPNP